ncbi:MAG: zinc-ribbon domain containing protein [Phycisphaerales bacterium]
MFTGKRKPTDMPSWLFPDGTRFDYTSAVRADTTRQDFSVEPRHWYVDATIRCDRCEQDFLFSADEQRFWYEE